MPSANRILRRLQACLRGRDVLRGSMSRAVLAIGIAWLTLTPVAQAVQLQAAAGLHEREAAADALATARQEVVAAQAETKRTRLALDQFMASHLDAQREAQARPSTTSTPIDADGEVQADLRGELRELQAKRVVLLQTLTDEHPEVLEITSRIESLEARLKTLASNELPGGEDSAGKAFVPAFDAAEYQRLLRDWQTAERRLESARLAETAANDRLTAVTDLLLHSAIGRDAPNNASARTPADLNPADQNPAQLTPATESEGPSANEAASATALPTTALPVAAGDLHGSKTPRSQTLALAALAFAVMLAALAAVRLARATADPLFASADEASAALAVPVMGIVPFGAKATMGGGSIGRRSFAMLAQIALALALFSAVAYVVVHFDVVLRLLSNPVETLRSWFGL